MNEGVKILLERMKTNPEEFTGTSLSTKWGQIIRLYEDYLEPEDQKALSAGVNKIQQQAFTETVMKNLLAPEEDNSLGKSFYTGHPTGMLSAGTTLGAYANTAHATQSTQLHDLLHQKALVEVNRKPTIKVRKPQHETLYGKLKNYLHSDT